MKRFALGLSGVLVFGVLMTACNSGPSVVGKWTGTIPAQGQQLPATVEYKADKTYVVKIAQNGMEFDISGTYEIKEDQMTSTVTSVNLLKIPQEMEQMRALAEQEVKKMEGVTETGTITFEGNDKLVMKSSEGNTMNLTRVKE